MSRFWGIIGYRSACLLVASSVFCPLYAQTGNRPASPAKHHPARGRALPPSTSPQPFSFERARALAYAGKAHRPEALAMLKAHLETSPDDTDSRVLYGTVLSWDGRYQEARKELEMVLAKNPTHGDALPALINVEFWSGHPAAALTLAQTGLKKEPDNVAYLLDEARALHDLGRNWQANKTYSRALSVEPTNQNLRQSVWSFRKQSGEYWEFSLDHSYETFSKIFGDQNLTTFSARGPTPIGSITFRENRADRFHESGYQSEIDFWPGFGHSTYGYLNVGYSNDVSLFPRWRFGAELFHDTHGYEFSGGYRYLHFSSDVNIYTFSFGKYWSNWFFDERTFLTPGTQPNEGLSNTELFSARRFFGSEGLHDYAEVFFSRGASPAQAATTLGFQVLNSYRAGFTLDKTFGHFSAAVNASVARAPQTYARNLNEYTLDGTIYYRF